MRGRKPLRDKSLAVSITGRQFPRMPKCRLQSIIRKEHGGYSLLSINYIKYVEKKQVERKKNCRNIRLLFCTNARIMKITGWQQKGRILWRN